MKKNSCLLICCLLLCVNQLIAQTAKELQENARSFMQQGDYANALLVLNRATQMEPQNLDITKDLALSYYLQRDFNKALSIIKPTLDKEEADDQCYQIAGNIYRQLDQEKESEKLYRKGIKRFPDSGPMYNELGESLLAQQDLSAIKQWEKGIEVEPGFSKNYFNASKFYFSNGNPVWAILYGEIFLNMEPFSNRSPEIKSLLLDGYKKLFQDAQIAIPDNQKNKFTEAFIKSMNNQSSVAAGGINTETLVMIRTRFILDWFNNGGEKTPFKLFELQRELLQEGLFDMYNQWIFGAVQNLAAYQNYTSTHATEYNEFTKLQRNRVFKIRPGNIIGKTICPIYRSCHSG